jgi:hypothetical protein
MSDGIASNLRRLRSIIPCATVTVFSLWHWGRFSSIGHVRTQGFVDGVKIQIELPNEGLFIR